MTEDRLTCTYFNAVTTPDSNIIGIFGLHIKSMDMYLSKVRLVRKKTGEMFAVGPAEKFQDPKSGETKYQNYWWFSGKSNEFFQGEVRKAISAYCLTKSIRDPLDVSITNSAETTEETELESSCPF